MHVIVVLQDKIVCAAHISYLHQQILMYVCCTAYLMVKSPATVCTSTILTLVAHHELVLCTATVVIIMNLD